VVYSKRQIILATDVDHLQALYTVEEIMAKQPERIKTEKDSRMKVGMSRKKNEIMHPMVVAIQISMRGHAGFEKHMKRTTLFSGLAICSISSLRSLFWFYFHPACTPVSRYKMED
jgi:hypothetical protein